MCCGCLDITLMKMVFWPGLTGNAYIRVLLDFGIVDGHDDSDVV